MAPHTVGATRKSHTKSRKGCRTCKRRHIRCDETFPQWYGLVCCILLRRRLTSLTARIAPSTTAGAIIWIILLQMRLLAVPKSRISSGLPGSRGRLQNGSGQAVFHFQKWVCSHSHIYICGGSLPMIYA